MNQTSNLLLMLVPKELLGPALLMLIVGGGLAIIVGARKLGQALIVTAIAFPLIGVVSAGVINSLLAALPPALAGVARFLAAAVIFLAVGWMIIKWIFGQSAIDQAKGELLADAVRGFFRLLFSRTGLLTTLVLAMLIYWNSAPG